MSLRKLGTIREAARGTSGMSGMSEKPEKCTKCGGKYISNLPSWKGVGWNCGTCGHNEGKVYPLKDTRSGRDCEEDYY